MDLLSFILGIAAGITIAHIFVILFRGRENIIMKPSDIADHTELNVFGQWLLYIVIAIFSPVIFLFKLIYLLVHIRR